MSDTSTHSSAAERQRKYRQRKQAGTKQLLHKVMEHGRFRARVLAAMERRRMDLYRLASITGITTQIIEAGDDADYGLFQPDEIEALCGVFPQVAPPDARL